MLQRPAVVFALGNADAAAVGLRCSTTTSAPVGGSASATDDPEAESGGPKLHYVRVHIQYRTDHLTNW